MKIPIEDIIFLEFDNVILHDGYVEWYDRIKSGEMPNIPVKYWKGKYLTIGNRHRCAVLYYEYGEDFVDASWSDRKIPKDLEMNLRDGNTCTIHDLSVMFIFEKKLVRK